MKKVILIILVIAVVLFGGFYYYIKHSAIITEKPIDNSLVSNKIKCKEYADAYTKKLEEKLSESVIEETYEKIENVFSQELNTCLHHVIYKTITGDGLVIWTNFEITDVYTNQKIASYSEHYDINGNVNNTEGNKEKYQTSYEKYFKNPN